MKKLIIFPVLFLFLSVAGQPAWKQGLRYQLHAKLDEKQKSLDGSMELWYTNHSPDTLRFIWFHIWPNAYRNDKTSYSEQSLENGKTDFYFSEKEKRGYINRLEFRVGGQIADIRDHPEYIDVIKLILPEALVPGDSLLVSASFHVKLSYNFSGCGYLGSNVQLCNWYPEPAVYDASGWHPMPFLEQGGAYHEAADYHVQIEASDAYRVAAGCSADTVFSNPGGFSTWRFSIENANSFSWTADKRFFFKKDSVQLESGRIIGMDLFYFPADSSLLETTLRNAKPMIRTLSAIISDYPYSSLTLAETMRPQEQCFSGMVRLSRKDLYTDANDLLISALTAQWFQTGCLSNGRTHPWMSKGFIEYYTRRMHKPDHDPYIRNRGGLKEKQLWLRVAEKERTTQPINTPADSLSPENYSIIAGTKSALWLKSLEDSLGRETFDRCVQSYFEEWKFGHPDPVNFQAAMEKASGRSLGNAFEELASGKSLFSSVTKRILKPRLNYAVGKSEQYNYIDIAPAFGYNRYDDFMIGAMIHNYNLPENDFQFLSIPLYSRKSKTIEGLGRISYSWHPEKDFRKITIGLSGSQFSSNYAKDSTGVSLFEGFSKLVPSLHFDFNKRSARSHLEKWIDIKSYLIWENRFSKYAVSSKDSLIHPNASSTSFRYLNQLSMNVRNDRALYPYDARIELQQTDLFYRINLNANYFFNYASGGGMRIRLFAAKFGVWNKNTTRDLSRYQPKLLGVTGEEDYTYDQYFIGRSASYAIENGSTPNDGFPAQQISIRDGGLKLRIDPYDYVQGRSANWVSALNFSTSLPAKLFPVPVPVRIFFDVGTYAEAWKTNAQTSRFLYTGGVQLSLFKNVLNIYAPIIYSSDFRDLIKTETFWKKLTFSIDIQNINYKKLLNQRPVYD